MKKINLFLILLVMLLGFTHPQVLPTHASMSVRHQANNSRTPHPNPTTITADAIDEDWVIECVDCARYFSNLTDHSLQLDANGYPHITYGGDDLYYTWFNGTEWIYETVDDAHYTGSHAALVLDNNGNPHLSYRNEFGMLKYASRGISGWQIETIDLEALSNEETAIVLDNNGSPHIIYASGDLSSRTLMHAYIDQDYWNIEIIDNAVASGEPNSLMVDEEGYLHVAYGRYNLGTTHDLMYAHQEVSGWQIETVERGGGYSISLALDDLGVPHISYISSGSLKHTFLDSNGWHTDIVDSVGYAYSSTSIAIDSNGYPHISFGVERTTLMLASWKEQGWQLESIDQCSIENTSLAIDSMRIPHIAYFCDQRIKYAYLNTNEWNVQEIDIMRGPIGISSLALDQDRIPHISFVNGGNLQYGIRNTAGWLFHTVAYEVPTQVTSMALDSANHPHISYSGDVLTYTYFDGTEWRFYTVNANWGEAQNTSLAIDELGYPHISSYYEICSSLKPVCELLNTNYAHMEASGWYTHTLDSTRGGYPSIALDSNGHPHVSFISLNSPVYPYQSLKYAYQDVEGWHDEIVDVGRFIGETSISIEIDREQKPHISYIDNGVLKYAYLSNNGWKIEIVDYPDCYSSVSMDLDYENKPHISYLCQTLKYTYLDSNGWNRETINQTGYSPSLVLDKYGYPHITFNHENDLLYAHLPAPKYKVTLWPNDIWLYGKPGETRKTTLIVRNRGMETDSYDFDVDGNSWFIYSPQTAGPLLAAEESDFKIFVTIPPTATLVSSDTATLTLTSQNDPSVTASATLTTYAAITTYLPMVER